MIAAFNGTQTIYSHLRKCKYPSWLLTRAINRINHIDRANLPAPRIKSNKNTRSSPAIFSTPFSVGFKEITKIMHKYLPVFYTDPLFFKVLKQGFRCVAPTLGIILSPILIQSQPPKNYTWLKYTGCYRGDYTKCIYCKYINVSKSFVSTNMQAANQIEEYMN